jgi:hypothetical protein
MRSLLLRSVVSGAAREASGSGDRLALLRAR